jgi:hypothetical protein
LRQKLGVCSFRVKEENCWLRMTLEAK